MRDLCTVNELYRPLMGRPSVGGRRCCVCGRPATNRHHIVPRSAGRLVEGGREVPKPTAPLCGMGNASGCHGLAHRHRLHFRWRDGWERLVTAEPTRYQEALATEEGWVRL